MAGMSGGIPPAMQSSKLWRSAALALQRAGFHIEEARATNSGRLAVTVSKDGKSATVPVASTPKDKDGACTMVVQMAKRRIRACQ
jgi:hypothetical protein